MAVPLTFCNHGLRPSGGIERYLATLVGGLHQRGLRPTVIAKRFDPSMPEFGWVDAVRVPMTGVPGKWRDFWFDWRLRRLKARHGWFPLIALNQTGAADIAVCGSNHPAHLASMQRTAGWLDRRKIALERAHLTRSAVILAHSQLLADQVQQHYGVAPSKIVVAHPPVDTARFSPVDDAHRRALRDRLGLPADRLVFLLASTGHARKGLDLAVQALGHSPLPVLLVVAGRPVPMKAPNLRYLGYRQDIEDVYRAVDCTLMPSRYEPFGLVGVESVLCGTPVIAARDVGCMEVLGPEAGLPIDLDDPASLQRAIDAMRVRHAEGRARLVSPFEHLRYDPGVQAHLDVLLSLVDSLRSAR